MFDLIREIRKFAPGRHHTGQQVIHIEHYNDMILRDHLGAERTRMANKRSFLLYIQTSPEIIKI